MKGKASITLSSDILAKVDRAAGSKQSRSAVIEQALRDLERINAAADRLNSEATEILDYRAVNSRGWLTSK